MQDDFNSLKNESQTLVEAPIKKTISNPTQFKVTHVLADGTALDSLDGFVVRDIPANKHVYAALEGIAERTLGRRNAGGAA